MIIAAYYYSKTSRRPAKLELCEMHTNGQQVWGKDFDVTDKRHARKVAAEYNATPWNF
jgi:hypothetical protein